MFCDSIGKNIALGIGVGIPDGMSNVIGDTQKYMKMLTNVVWKIISLVLFIEKLVIN
ncbi:MAG: hypothetical protein FWD71_07095 [Oscillospiraceae bacterium]|nr:hypothetical protein [Oscillospiraceae bacterium]